MLKSIDIHILFIYNNTRKLNIRFSPKTASAKVNLAEVS